jgi:hypothetical protein
LQGARIGLLTAMLGTDPADAEVAGIVRGAVAEMKGQGAEIVEVSIPDLAALLTDKAKGFLITRQDFKFDLNAYLAAHPSAPVRTLDEVLASGKSTPPSKELAQFSIRRISRHPGIPGAHCQT